MLTRLAAAVALGAAVLVVPTMASAASACDVTYTVNSWSNGFTADVKVTNRSAAVSPWTLTWTFPGDQRVTSGWSATVTQSGSAVTAAAPSWAPSLGTGASASFGFQGTYSGTNTAPASFSLNGVRCGEDTTTPPSSPPPSDPPPSNPPPTDPPTSPPPGTPSGTEGFEGSTANWTTTYPDCSGAGKATFDGSVAHSGSKSLRIDGAAGYCNHVFVRNTSLLPSGNVWFVRYWVRHTTVLPASHITTVALQDTADGNRDLRFGGQNGALQWNRASDDATLPEQSPAGVAQSAPLPTGSWNCVEFKVNGTDGTMQTWLNGTSVPGLLEDGVPTHDVDGQWLNKTYRPRLADLKLGWESYGEGSDTLWYDDVAASTSRIGC
ncbi:cellulose-binding domain-containing protein [Nucisporomicrobium flavum]|uniref:cellulose-binding domain-containing protein n=1 Tax=Nucisporomicrobium flavum TaxID=2785915 RepID=UPI003C2EC69B